jgi:hypothetical protein
MGVKLRPSLFIPVQEKNSQNNLIDVEFPLITLMDIEPHSIKLLVKPKEFHPQTMVISVFL